MKVGCPFVRGKWDDGKRIDFFYRNPALNFDLTEQKGTTNR
jgi:hypothetical protein